MKSKNNEILTYRKLKNRLETILEHELDLEVQIFDMSNDCMVDVHCFANDLEERYPHYAYKNCIIVD